MHLAAVKADGTVLAWGQNSAGQTNVPAGLSGVIALAAGFEHTLALKADGTVVAWGSNSFGESTVPAGLSNVRAISANEATSAVLKADGTIVVWGWAAAAVANFPPGLHDVQAFSLGSNFMLALQSDGTVVAWGGDYPGQLSAPAGLTGVQAISAGYGHALALKNDGTVVGWGLNFFGQASGGAGLSGVKSISAGYRHSAAAVMPSVSFGSQPVMTDGAAKTFTVKNSGAGPLTVSSVSTAGVHAADFSVDTAGLLNSVPALNGQTSFTVTFHPVAIGTRTAVLRVLSDDSDESPFDIVITGNGILSNDATLANLSLSTGTLSPVFSAAVTEYTATVPHSVSNVTLTPVAGHASAVVKVDAAVVASGTPSGDISLTDGLNVIPVLVTAGDGTTTTTYTVSVTRAPGAPETGVQLTTDAPGSAGILTPSIPIRKVVAWGGNSEQQTDVPWDLTDATAIAAGQYHSMALKEDGSVVAWGSNGAYGFIYGTADVPAGLTGVKAIAGGSRHSVALKTDDSVVVWGENSDNQFGVPNGLSALSSIVASGYTTAVLKQNGTVVPWGTPLNGAVGAFPAGLTNVVQIAAGGSHMGAVKADGTVVMWGNPDENYFGAFTVPPGLTNVRSMATSGTYTIAVKNDGTIATWGDPEMLALIPPGLTGVQAAAVSSSHGAVLRNDGTVTAWASPFVPAAGMVPVGLANVSAIAAGDDHTLALCDSRAAPPVSFGVVAVNMLAPEVTFTITNTGNRPLRPGTVVINGPNRLDFSLSPPSFAPVFPGGSATFAVSFIPGGTGSRRAVLTVTSDDPVIPSFDIPLIGTGLTHLEWWRNDRFGTTANTGAAADDADPNHNGIPNLQEYAFQGDPAGLTTGTSILPIASLDAAERRQLVFQRVVIFTGATLTVQASDDMVSWTNLGRSVHGAAYTALVPGAVFTDESGPNTDYFTVKVSDLYPVSDPDHPRRYMRVLVTP